MTDARKRIEEVIRTVEIQAANHQYMDERGGGEPAPDALAATSAIIAIVREALLTDGVQAVEDMLRFHHGDFTDIDSIPRISRRTLIDSLDAAFGADDDGGER